MAKKIAIISLSLIGAMTISNVSIAQDPGLGGIGVDGKEIGALSPAVPFLRISPDARAGAMGDAGIATTADANSQHWNVGKVVTNEKDFGASVTYTPWLRQLGIDDMFLGYLSGFYKFGKEKNQALSASLRYFNLGDINYTDNDGNPIGTGSPREMSFDVGYSRKLSDNLSLGVALRYINSNIAQGSQASNIDYNPGNAFAGDVGVYYSKTTEQSEDVKSTFSAGAVLSNIGSKISYSEVNKDFIPTNLGIGAAYTYQFDQFNKITGTVDFNKLLIPPAIKRNDQWNRPDYSVVKGMMQSFVEAPGFYGSVASLGAEYWYMNQFAVRAGYFYEAPSNGGRQYFTCGLGIKYMSFGFNFSYLVPAVIATNSQNTGVVTNPLANTLRFSLTFDFDQTKS
jgi:hypothetical protein